MTKVTGNSAFHYSLEIVCVYMWISTCVQILLFKNSVAFLTWVSLFSSYDRSSPTPSVCQQTYSVHVRLSWTIWSTYTGLWSHSCPPELRHEEQTEHALTLGTRHVLNCSTPCALCHAPQLQHTTWTTTPLWWQHRICKGPAPTLVITCKISSRPKHLIECSLPRVTASHVTQDTKYSIIRSTQYKAMHY